jgi:hypothetical protein
MRHKYLLFVVVVVGILTGFVYGQDENKPWEKLGLSQTEWRMITDNKISMSKVEQLLKYGISIGEYFQKPWESLKMTEDRWVKKRRSGLTSYDIELEAQRDNESWKKEMKSDAGKDVHQLTENGEMFSSLSLPGYYQWQTNQKVKGSVMASLAAGSLIWCTVGSITEKHFEVLPIVFILVQDMVWSFIDYKIKNRKERTSL